MRLIFEQGEILEFFSEKIAIFAKAMHLMTAMSTVKWITFNVFKRPGGSFGHQGLTHWENGHQNSLLLQKTSNISLIPKYEVFWGKSEFWWPFSQWVSPWWPNEPPGLLNTLKVFHLTVDIAVIRCIACAEIAIFSEKTSKISPCSNISLMPKYEVFWGKIEFWWPFSQWVRPRCPNEPPGLLNTLKVFHLTIDNSVIRCIACAEIAKLTKKSSKKVTSLVPAVAKHRQSPLSRKMKVKPC